MAANMQPTLIPLPKGQSVTDSGRIPAPPLILTSRELVDLLRLKHPAPQWATFPELRCSTGFTGFSGVPLNGDQRIDVFTLNTWPSSGFESIAYEVKVSRGDFLREMRLPHKRAFAEKMATHCIFAIPQGHVTREEIPDPWGLLLIHRSKEGRLYYRMAKPPVQIRKGRDCQWPMGFIASIARRSAVEQG